MLGKRPAHRVGREQIGHAGALGKSDHGHAVGVDEGEARQMVGGGVGVAGAHGVDRRTWQARAAAHAAGDTALGEAVQHEGDIAVLKGG